MLCSFFRQPQKRLITAACNSRLLTVLCLLFVAFLFQNCRTAVRIVRYNHPNIDDYRLFPTRSLPKPEISTELPRKPNIALPPPAFWMLEKRVDSTETAEAFLEKYGTNALIIVKNDTIVYEKYFNNRKPDDKQVCFSISKAMVSAAVGAAIEEGKIQSLEQRVVDFLPEFTGNGRDSIRLKHLINMVSGLNHDEYKKYIKTGIMYYGSDHRRFVLKAQPRRRPGSHFTYKSVDTQLLGICLEKATGMPVSQYVYEKIWKPLGPEFDAEWCLDSPDGLEKMFCGLVARPRDLAKFGQMYLHSGEYNDQQIVPKSWAALAGRRDTFAGSYLSYSHCWWRYTSKHQYKNSFDSDFFASGLHGQVVYVNPKEKTTIIRFGSKSHGISWAYAMSMLAKMPTEPLQPRVPKNIQAQLAGEYRGANDRRVKVYFENNQLFLAAKKMKPVALIAETLTNFINIAGDCRLTFDADGLLRWEEFGHSSCFVKLQNSELGR